MKRQAYSLLVTLLGFTLLLSSCDKTVEVGPSGSTLNTDDLAKAIAKRLDGRCVGYQLVISVNGSQKSIYANGDARLAQDGNPRSMFVNDKYNIASCSKTITAAALLRALNAKQKTADDLIHPYLPTHWALGTGIKTITFKQLLTHRSGFADTTYGSDYAGLKKLVGKGLIDASKPEKYNNANYALMRFLITTLAGYTVTSLPANANSTTLATVETKQAQEYADDYIDYCQKNVLGVSGSGMNTIVCKPTDPYPALCYQFPKDNGKGTDFGDMTLTNAERGWNMTTVQMAAFLSTLHYTEKIIPKSLSDMMKNDRAGYDSRSTTTDKMGYYAKSGGYPGKYANKVLDGTNFGKNYNAGQLESWLIGFDNNVQVAFIANSQVFVTTNKNDAPNGELAIDSILAAFDEWYKSAKK
ncbi:serine hydrolase domain-containing protein [Spirosoma agri]|uniref:Serine hydrolase n=1 Tax=Spirosoma agri TaxID=1987381 RepID=A0A6M0IDP6_9BACT|nr:serine hydrolase [Spirosoma agri]NEU66298.1 serine hydrolase [Spirosoma agri]